MTTDSQSTEASPLKSACEELDHLRQVLRETAAAFQGRLEADLIRIRETIGGDETRRRKPNRQQLSDLRDMISLMRSIELKPQKGRRRDLKKIEVLIEDLRQLAEGW
jgi:hypothetical protein